jgi:hypothetical protein
VADGDENGEEVIVVVIIVRGRSWWCRLPVYVGARERGGVDEEAKTCSPA